MSQGKAIQKMTTVYGGKSFGKAAKSSKIKSTRSHRKKAAIVSQRSRSPQNTPDDSPNSSGKSTPRSTSTNHSRKKLRRRRARSHSAGRKPVRPKRLERSSSPCPRRRKAHKLETNLRKVNTKTTVQAVNTVDQLSNAIGKLKGLTPTEKKYVQKAILAAKQGVFSFADFHINGPSNVTGEVQTDLWNYKQETGKSIKYPSRSKALDLAKKAIQKAADVHAMVREDLNKVFQEILATDGDINDAKAALDAALEQYGQGMVDVVETAFKGYVFDRSPEKMDVKQRVAELYAHATSNDHDKKVWTPRTKETTAATEIQTTYRNYRKKMTTAVTMIQKSVRAKQARARVAAAKATLSLQDTQITTIDEASATFANANDLLQKTLDDIKAQKQVKYKMAEALTAAVARNRAKIQAESRRNQAATDVQKIVRGHLVRHQNITVAETDSVQANEGSGSTAWIKSQNITRLLNQDEPYCTGQGLLDYINAAQAEGYTGFDDLIPLKSYLAAHADENIIQSKGDVVFFLKENAIGTHDHGLSAKEGEWVDISTFVK